MTAEQISLYVSYRAFWCQSLGSRPTQVQDVFILVPRLFGTTPCCLSVQPFPLLPSRKIWRHISLTWPFLHRHRHAEWPVHVTELFLRFCCWTLILLLRHWAWFHRGYWRYRNLIDGLIDWTNPAKSAQNIGVIFEEISPSAHMYRQSPAHVFTISGIWDCFSDVFDNTAFHPTLACGAFIESLRGIFLHEVSLLLFFPLV